MLQKTGEGRRRSFIFTEIYVKILAGNRKREYTEGMNGRTENQFERMTEIMNTIPAGERLLLHSCCAPCSSACLELLHEHFQVTVFYYNPNIEEEAEYQKRKDEQIRFLQATGWADFLDCDYAAADFRKISAGLEDCPERGERCRKCYELRLRRTAEEAKERGFDYFTTTLSVSPYKVSRWINEIGCALEAETGVKFLPSDFKKRGGYLRSMQLSAEYGLYRQDFCGCSFSKREREKKRQK